MCKLLEQFGQSSQHMSVLYHGLREMTIQQARQNAEMLQSSISECEAQDLKRLEVELRLIQVSFRVILVTGGIWNLDLKPNFDKARATCAQFPDTAGVFFPIYQSLRQSYEGKPSSKELYTRENREFWRLWGHYKTGKLSYCQYGHPYSTSVFPGCPECGREVVPKKEDEAVNYNNFLREQDFVMQMMNMNATTKTN